MRFNHQPGLVVISCTNRARVAKKRRGAILGLALFVVPMLLIMGAFAVNLAHIQLTRAEQMVATDAASRACGRAFSLYQDIDRAQLAAQQTGALNHVAGRALQLSLDDSDGMIDFGVSKTVGNSGRYKFTRIDENTIRTGLATPNSSRISGQTLNVPFLFPNILGQNTFDVAHASVASQSDRDIALVLDRSGSMGRHDNGYYFPVRPYSTYETKLAAVNAGILYQVMPNTDWFEYTKGRGHNSYTYHKFLWEDYYQLGPKPPSDWDNLVTAVEAFLTVLDETIPIEYVSATTYSEDAAIDHQLDVDYGGLRDAIAARHPTNTTAIGLGMQEALKTLTGSAARPYAAKTLVVMTDGNHNRGVGPITVAKNALANMNVTIHTVTFGRKANVGEMRRLAHLGKGKHYHADTATELITIYKKIANNLPTTMTQ